MRVDTLQRVKSHVELRATTDKACNTSQTTGVSDAISEGEKKTTKTQPNYGKLVIIDMFLSKFYFSEHALYSRETTARVYPPKPTFPHVREFAFIVVADTCRNTAGPS